ncbi:MAG TPA: hypothetical protein DDY25_00515 [Peptococcaceae bacterium]|nr:hypothetical protein [Peptococcaceae bacterium]
MPCFFISYLVKVYESRNKKKGMWVCEEVKWLLEFRAVPTIVFYKGGEKVFEFSKALFHVWFAMMVNWDVLARFRGHFIKMINKIINLINLMSFSENASYDKIFIRHMNLGVFLTIKRFFDSK